MDTSIPNFRPGNRPLAHLRRHYDVSDVKVGFLVQSLPRLAQDLSDLTERVTKQLSRDYQLGDDFDYTGLSHCVFDLLLTSLFQEAQKYSGNNDLASLVVDSVLYEVTGCLPSSPTELDLICGQTHTARGIHKFELAREKWAHISSAATYLFGKEFSTLKDGVAEIDTVLSVATYAVRARVHAKWSVEHIFYGAVPSEEQQQALEASLAEQDRALRKELKDDKS